ncbi:type I-E CRISPR-associated protein Cas7/Cse4/CasC [Streptoalloteichus hindustanus]|uniref:CRISPR system Cascade subunit CasC n=1 Tax=Streptoalloteichus hindustanus TaxID=2017 RepID=A0A1M5CUR9_STRHI|nr:type I-E CRISPR-associated protein Cas7/Cse4/CasC [Streptoalloteichus hindustanus]SHF58464.1 CRISPR system Cascade subunit CasC [Streptoalloteichus hindustanus]
MAQRRYLDVHILQTVPPANLNRDDQGNPKEAYFGGVRRSRVSSQAWKRATRKFFDEHESGLSKEDLGVRTKRIVSKLSSAVVEHTTAVDPETAGRLAAEVVSTLGIKPGKKEGDTAYLLFYGRRQLSALADLVASRAEELAVLDESALKSELKKLPIADTLGKGHPVDVALFGRMVADVPALNVDAATQVAHALSTHATELEFDYFTAVDDENEKEEPGAGMIGTVGFNSATLYRYATVGLHQLVDNLGDVDAARRAAGLFVESFARSMPTGHGNAFAHRTLPHLVAISVRADQPVNLVSAFENPVPANQGIAAASARRLAREQRTAVRNWGDQPLHQGLCHSFGDEELAAELAEAFGPARTFAELLTELDAHLAGFGEHA